MARPLNHTITARPGRPSTAGWARLILLSGSLVGLYLLVAVWGFAFTPDQYGIPLVWPATGVGLAFVFLYGYRLVPAVGLAAALVGVWFTGDLVAPLEQAFTVVATMLATALGTAILRYCRFDPRMERLRDLGLLLAAGGGVSSGLAATVGAYSLAASPGPLSLAQTWWVCWSADLMGLVLISPFLFTLLGGRLVMPSGADLRIGMMLVTATLATGAVAYLLALDLTLALPLSYAVFPLVMYAALRCPAPITSGLILVFGGLALTATGLGHGPYAALGLERSLLALNAQLGLLVLTGLSLTAISAEREAAESRARQHLEDLARAGRINLMGQLSTTLAHELNQPLCALSTYAQASRRLLARGDTEGLGTALERLEQNAHRAAHTVRQIRDFAARQDLAHQVVAPAHLIAGVERLMAPEFTRHGIHLKVNVQPGLPPIRIAPMQIEQVLVNLLRNATEALADRSDGRVRLAVYRRRRELVLEVIDNGPGIPPERLSQLFDPFTSWKRGGMGLGLALSRSLVESHGGTFTARNSNAGGAEFRFTLPLEDDHGDTATYGTSGG
ncbi:ATP-binding protein [Alkalilimnicola ehrlichii]|uniref:ATP-binding protein n=1 Tax=Alkalilimnicola ehrlichii TaxID=351052 RepID=UPI003BA04E19